jgi:hypothetical protein
MKQCADDLQIFDVILGKNLKHVCNSYLRVVSSRRTSPTRKVGTGRGVSLRVVIYLYDQAL